MLLQSIILELDHRLDRLIALHNIVASLAKSPAVVCNLSIDLSNPVQAEPASHGAPKRRLSPRMRQSLREAPSPKKVLPEFGPLVLSRSISAAPVVVSHRQLQEEGQRHVASKAQRAVAVGNLPAEVVDLDEMSRSLSARWFVGAAQ